MVTDCLVAHSNLKLGIKLLHLPSLKSISVTSSQRKDPTQNIITSWIIKLLSTTKQVFMLRELANLVLIYSAVKRNSSRHFWAAEAKLLAVS